MGYNAVVKCNCYRDGLTTEPPHKEYVQKTRKQYILILMDSA